MFVTTSRFWLAWLALMCVGILLCTRQASEVYSQRNMQAERDMPEERKPQHDGGNVKGTVAMKILNRDAVFGPQQPNDIECSPTRQRQQDKRNQSRYKNSNNGNDDNDEDDNNNNDYDKRVLAEEEMEVVEEQEELPHLNLENGVDYDRARRMRWVENVCAFIRRPLVDYIYQQVMDARMRKLQELDIGNLLPSGSQSTVNIHPTRSHRRKRQPNTREADPTGLKASTAKRSRRLALLNLKAKLMEILNNAVGYANTVTANEGERVAILDNSQRMLWNQSNEKVGLLGGGNNGGNSGSCSCHQQLLKSTHTLASKF